MADARMALALFIFILSNLVVQSKGQDATSKITCFDWEGNGYPNNTQCPGSHICCQTEDQCNSNRFCYSKGQIVVPTCSLWPWETCANICQYVTGTGFLPRVQECSDGSFCCDNDPRCCVENRGIVLNGLGAIVSTDPGTSTTTSTSSSITPSSSITSTSSITSSSSTASLAISSSTTTPSVSTTSPAISPPTTSSTTKHGTLGTSASVGIAVGAVIAVVGIGSLVGCYMCARRRTKNFRAETATVWAELPKTELPAFQEDRKLVGAPRSGTWSQQKGQHSGNEFLYDRPTEMHELNAERNSMSKPDARR